MCRSRDGVFAVLVLLFAALLATVACGGSSGAGAEPVFVRASLASQRFSLENGLDVVLHPDPSFRSVAINVRYEVGSRHDPSERTGLAHLVEHLTFRTKPNGTRDAFTLLEQAGSSSHNAETNVGWSPSSATQRGSRGTSKRSGSAESSSRSADRVGDAHGMQWSPMQWPVAQSASFAQC